MNLMSTVLYRHQIMNLRVIVVVDRHGFLEV
jgi:hypothetical protein